MAVETPNKDAVVEFSKMMIEHSGTLLQVAGALIIINLVLIAHLNDPKSAPRPNRAPSVLMVLSIFACGGSFICGYLSNAAVIGKMSEYAQKNEWKGVDTAEYFMLFQIGGLIAGIGVFLATVLFFRKATMAAIRETGLGGGG